MRNETEWVETVNSKSNVLVGTDKNIVLEWINKFTKNQWIPCFGEKYYGDGDAAKIVDILLSKQKVKLMFKSTNLWLSLTIRYLAGALIIFWLMKTQTLDFSRVLSLSAHFIIYGSCFVLIQLCLSAARIKILLNDQNVKATMIDCIQFNCVGIFTSTFLPGGISGDLVRAYFFWKKYPHYSKTSMAGALFLDRFFGLAMMICIGLIAGTIMLSVDQTYKQFLIVGWISFFVGTFIFIISISKINTAT